MGKGIFNLLGVLAAHLLPQFGKTSDGVVKKDLQNRAVRVKGRFLHPFKPVSAWNPAIPSRKHSNTFGIVVRFLAMLLILLSCSVRPAFSDTVSYTYDSLGRLTMTVSSGGAVVVYEYDAAGRVISTTRTSKNQQTPVLTGINPNNAIIGSDLDITITGANLLTTKAVSADDPGIQILYFSASENSISVSAHIQNSAATGPVVFTVETLSGTASISSNLIRLTFTPAQISLITGTSESITATIEGLTGDYNLVLANNNPEVITAQESLLVPLSGSATFTVNALSGGSAVISAGNSWVTAFVAASFTGPCTASGKPVSVGVENFYWDSSGTYARPFSVQIEPYLNHGISVSPPVSVWPGFIWGKVVADPQVSVKIAPE